MTTTSRVRAPCNVALRGLGSGKRSALPLCPWSLSRMTSQEGVFPMLQSQWRQIARLLLLRRTIDIAITSQTTPFDTRVLGLFNWAHLQALAPAPSGLRVGRQAIHDRTVAGGWNRGSLGGGVGVDHDAVSFVGTHIGDFQDWQLHRKDASDLRSQDVPIPQSRR